MEDKMVDFQLGFPTASSAWAAQHGQDLRRALEAYHFFYPTVSMEGIVRGTRNAGAADNQAAFMVLAQPRHRGFTLNSDTPYAGGILDLRDSGPMVVEVPRGPLVGLVDDHHQRWVADLGLPGPDAGKGGRHLILPPGWDGPVPDGFLTARCGTWTALLALRALPLRRDLDAAKRLLTSVQVYPLAKQDGPPRYSYLDRTDQAADTTCLAGLVTAARQAGRPPNPAARGATDAFSQRAARIPGLAGSRPQSGRHRQLSTRRGSRSAAPHHRARNRPRSRRPTRPAVSSPRQSALAEDPGGPPL
jgi:Protein of unknown function (DUF1254)